MNKVSPEFIKQVAGTYVVYITFYRGNRLPPFYIGKTSKSNVLKGYNGTVSSKKYKAVWLQERIDHPELFKTVILSYHTTEGEALFRETHILRFFNAANNPMFINLTNGDEKFGLIGPRGPRPDLVERNKKGHTPESRLAIRNSKRAYWGKEENRRAQSVRKLKFYEDNPEAALEHSKRIVGFYKTHPEAKEILRDAITKNRGKLIEGKRARGNIFAADNGLSRMGPFGAAYNK
jgi:hypothetical protein